MKEFGEFLSERNIGGYYRTTINIEGEEEVRGPYPTRERANPYSGHRLPYGLVITADYRFRKPKNVVPPDPIELEGFEE